MGLFEKMESICRTCGCESNEVIPIFKKQTFGNAEMVISDAISKCSSVQAHNGDELPQQICKKCFKELSTTISFGRRCKEMVSIFRTKAEQFHRADDGVFNTHLQIKTEPVIAEEGTVEEMETIQVKQETRNTFLKLECDTFTDDKLEEKIQFPVVAPYSCNKCNNTYDGFASYQTHNEIKHGGESSKYAQNITNDGSSNEGSNLIVPSTSAETSRTNEKCGTECVCEHEDNFVESNEINGRFTHEVTHICNMCCKRFAKKKSLRAHQSYHKLVKRHECKVCKKRFLFKGGLRKHVMTHTGEKPLKCDVCDYSCIIGSNMKVHVASHTGVKPYECDTCGGRFISKGKLKAHLVSHSNEKPFSCYVCDFRCALKSGIKRHVIIHTQEKRFKCDVCDEAFLRRIHLKRHVTIHAAEKPSEREVGNHTNRHTTTRTKKRFYCKVCYYSSATRSGMKRHMATHTWEKPFNCHICDFCCTSKSIMERHVITHAGRKPLNCDDCDYRCINKSSMKRHMMIHTGEKPYKCDTCNYTCVMKSQLNVHIMIHTGEKRFGCDLCDYRCIHKNQLTNHMRKH